MAKFHLHHEDAFAWLDRQEPRSFDVTITDPPYTGLVHDNVANVYSAKSKKLKRRLFIPIDFAPFSPEEVERLTLELLRVTKRWVVIFCALEQIGLYAAAAGPKCYVRSGCYRRAQSTPQLSGDRPGQAVEGVVILHRTGKKRWNGGGGHAFWNASRDRGERLHPTQKPVSLMLDLVEQFSDTSETVLDPFMGSGTTGVAALRVGRSFVGVEKAEKAYQDACDRLAAEAMNHDLEHHRRRQMVMFPPTHTAGEIAECSR